jgi:RNA polymerase sigma-70 factor, ECF subfamily
MSASEQPTNEAELIAALRRGEEAAFVALINQHHASLVRVAQLYVPSRAVAEEVAQETWLGVLQGIDRFEGRSSLKTWIFRILTNRARTRGERESRSIPFADLATVTDEPYEGAVDPGAFLPDGHAYAGWWASPPQSWQGAPEERLLAGETRERIAAAIALLPPNQRSVITLRDVEGWSAEEVATLLGVSDANQRVLLHRARAKVRRELERYLSDEAVVL